MACPAEKVANISGVAGMLIGEKRALVCGYVYVCKDCALALRGLAPRSILAVFMAGVQGWIFLGPCTQVQPVGVMSTGTCRHILLQAP